MTSSTWDKFDALCAKQNEEIQLSLENTAMAAIQVAMNEVKDLRGPVTYALQHGLTSDDNWLTLVGILQERPMALAPEMDTKFYQKCPKPLIEEFVAGEKGVFTKLLDRISNKTDTGDGSGLLEQIEIRAMHIVVDSLLVLGQTERLKRVAKMFQGICETHSESGQLPGSLYKKLLDKKIIEQKPLAQQASPISRQKTSPARKIVPRNTREHYDDDPATSSEVAGEDPREYNNPPATAKLADSAKIDLSGLRLNGHPTVVEAAPAEAQVLAN